MTIKSRHSWVIAVTHEPDAISKRFGASWTVRSYRLSDGRTVLVAATPDVSIQERREVVEVLPLPDPLLTSAVILSKRFHSAAERGTGELLLNASILPRRIENDPRREKREIRNHGRSRCLLQVGPTKDCGGETEKNDGSQPVRPYLACSVTGR